MYWSCPYPWQKALWQQICQQKQRGRIAHAYLLGGDAGLGKADFAQAFAALLLCENATTDAACGQCRSCTLLASGSQPDFLEIAPEEGSKVVKIDQVRQMADFIGKTRHGAVAKLVILHQADALNGAAANALLKTLEEPPGNTVLLLLSNRPGALLATIRSRCQKLHFRIPEWQDAAAWLATKLPELDSQFLLQQAQGRPLQALRMHSDGSLETGLKVLRGIVGLWSGKIPATELVELCKTLEAVQLHTQFYQLSSILIKALLARDVSATSDKTLQGLIQQLAGLSAGQRDQALEQLLAINQSAAQARNQLMGSANPNPGLILQSLIGQWYQLGTL